MLTIRFYTKLGTYKGWLKFDSDNKQESLHWVKSDNILKIGENEYNRNNLKDLIDLFKYELHVKRMYECFEVLKDV